MADKVETPDPAAIPAGSSLIDAAARTKRVEDPGEWTATATSPRWSVEPWGMQQTYAFFRFALAMAFVLAAVVIGSMLLERSSELTTATQRSGPASGTTVATPPTEATTEPTTPGTSPATGPVSEPATGATPTTTGAPATDETTEMTDATDATEEPAAGVTADVATTTAVVAGPTYDTTTGQALQLGLGWAAVVACAIAALLVMLGYRPLNHEMTSTVKARPPAELKVNLIEQPPGEGATVGDAFGLVRLAGGVLSAGKVIEAFMPLAEVADASTKPPSTPTGHREPVAIGGIIAAIASAAAVWGINDESISGGAAAVIGILLILLIAGVTLYQRGRVTPTNSPRNDQNEKLVPEGSKKT